MAQAHSAQALKKWKKWGSITHSTDQANKVKKMFIIWKSNFVIYDKSIFKMFKTVFLFEKVHFEWSKLWTTGWQHQEVSFEFIALIFLLIVQGSIAWISAIPTPSFLPSERNEGERVGMTGILATDSKSWTMGESYTTPIYIFKKLVIF
jgi:hypothetical protein